MKPIASLRRNPPAAMTEILSSDSKTLIDSDLEAMVLGTILRGGEQEYREVDFLSSDDFAVGKYRIIFDAITRIAPEVELTSGAVFDELVATRKDGVVGGISGLLEVQGHGIPGIGLGRFARQLRQKADARRASRLSEELSAVIGLGSGVNSDKVRALLEELRGLAGDNSPERGNERIEDLPAVGEIQEPLNYIAEPELPEGSVTALVGDAGCGKTTLAAALVRNAIAARRSGLILDRENPRHHALNMMRRIGLEDGPSLRWAGGWSKKSVPQPDSPVVTAWVKAATPKPIVVVDSLAAFLEGDENSASDMRRFMDGLRRLADLGAGVAVLHHDGKGDSTRDYRGSSDFKASVDQAFHLTNISSEPGKLDRIRLRCFKSRFGLANELVYNYAGGRMVRDERPHAPAITVSDQLTALLRQNPGVNGTEFEAKAEAISIGRNRSRDFLNNGLSAGVVRRESGRRNSKNYYLVGGNDD